MRKSAYVLAILAVAVSTATAKDLKQDEKATATNVAATKMTDAEMDKITAGAAGGATYYLGVRNPHGHLVPDAAWHNQARFTCQNCP
jgi:hypothetical protein